MITHVRVLISRDKEIAISRVCLKMPMLFMGAPLDIVTEIDLISIVVSKGLMQKLA